MEGWLHPLIIFLHHHPHWGGAFAFAIAFIESVAVLGTLVPGSVTMTAIGALIGADILPLVSTFIWAIAGALFGDTISYWLGYRYCDKLKNIWPFKKRPTLLEYGENFFAKHGGKSVIIGRFVGPARSMVPMIAGFLKLKPARFFPAIVVSAAAWAILYIAPGIVLGALALELPAGMATRFLIYCLVVIAVVWLLTWLIKISAQRIIALVDKGSEKLWRYLTKHHYSHWIVSLLTNHNKPENHQQVNLVFAFIICFALFLAVLSSVVSQDFLAQLNYPIQHLLFSLRNATTDKIFIAITLLADKHVELLMAGLLFCVFVINKYWRLAWHWLALTIASAGTIYALKLSIISPRPQQLLHVKPTSSFPSGHFSLTFVLLGFLTVLIAETLPKAQQKTAYLVAVWLLVLVAFSRLYLGAHWPTDILGGTFIALCFILVGLIAYRRKPAKLPSAKFLIIATCLCLGIAWVGYGSYAFKKNIEEYKPYWPSYKISLTHWWQQINSPLPLYRDNRFGKPAEAFNVQLLSPLPELRRVLLHRGWKVYSLELKTRIKLFAEKSSQNRLPFFVKLYNNQKPVLVMIKQRGGKPALILQLWHSHAFIPGTDMQLWIGSLDYHIAPMHYLQRLHKRYLIEYSNVLRLLMADLARDYTMKIQQTPLRLQPADTRQLKWKGEILLAKPL